MALVQFGQLTEHMSRIETGHILAGFALLMTAVFAMALWIRSYQQFPVLACKTMLGVQLATAALYGSGILRICKEDLESRPVRQPDAIVFLLYWLILLIYSCSRCGSVANKVMLLWKGEGHFAVWISVMLASCAAATGGIFAILSAIFCFSLTWTHLLLWSACYGVVATLGMVAVSRIRKLRIWRTLPHCRKA